MTEEKKIETKKSLLKKIEELDNSKKVSFTVEEFKNLFKENQLNRGWTKEHLQFLMENTKHG